MLRPSGLTTQTVTASVHFDKDHHNRTTMPSHMGPKALACANLVRTGVAAGRQHLLRRRLGNVNKQLTKTDQ
jgi:hypothetical protein